MVAVVPYETGRKDEWNSFVNKSRNGTFLLHRDYMEYHADRFPDYSLMLYDHRTLVALLPGTRDGISYLSHAGLTYGGFVSGASMGTPLMMECFDAVCLHLKRDGIQRLLYKAIPHIYHSGPAEEDLYALFRAGATLLKRDVSSAIRLPCRRIGGHRGRGAAKAAEKGAEVRTTADAAIFLEIADRNLFERHGVHPVHSAAEMELLMSRFPDNIRLFGAYHGTEMIAGALMYVCPTVAHLQYLAASPKGRALRAADLLVVTLVQDVFRHMRWFDFGISTEQGGHVLNEGLIRQKEEFGASAVCYDTYLVELST